MNQAGIANRSFADADELLQQYLRQFIESHAAAPEVTIAWQGGEPTLMGLDFFRRAVAIAERFARPGQQLVIREPAVVLAIGHKG